MFCTKTNAFSTKPDVAAKNLKLVKQRPTALHKFMLSKDTKDYQNDAIFFKADNSNELMFDRKRIGLPKHERQYLYQKHP